MDLLGPGGDNSLVLLSPSSLTTMLVTSTLFPPDKLSNKCLKIAPNDYALLTPYNDLA